MKILFAALSAFLLIGITEGAGDAYPRTKSGITELKTLPEGRLLESRGAAPYFSGSNRLFGPLFQYISRHNISMTSPVEARMDPGAMYFWVDASEVEKAKENDRGVEVIDVPSRLVASKGARGKYGSSNYEMIRKKLILWVESREDIEMIGEPFGVFWDGPFTPSFLKEFEVQVEVRGVGN